MREILFRGKRCDNGEWVQGYYIRAEHHWHKHGIHKDWITLGASANGGWFALHNKYAVKAETIGQYTGLTDKNGKKIFEGDIVKTDKFNSPNKLYIIQFDLLLGAFIGEAVNTMYFTTFDGDSDYFEIVGNMHDNPELLGGE